MKAAKHLKRAMARIAKPEAWAQGAFARDDAGRPVAPDLSYVAAWSVEGALMAEGYPLDPGTYNGEEERKCPGLLRAWRILNECVPGPMGVGTWGDLPGVGHTDALVLLGQAHWRAVSEEA